MTSMKLENRTCIAHLVEPIVEQLRARARSRPGYYVRWHRKIWKKQNTKFVK